MWKQYDWWFRLGSVILILSAVAGVFGLFWNVDPANDPGTLYSSVLNVNVRGLIGQEKLLYEVYTFLFVGFSFMTFFIGIQNLFIIRAPIADKAKGWILRANVIFWLMVSISIFLFAFLLPTVFYGVSAICFIIALILHRSVSTQHPQHAHYPDNRSAHRE